LYQSTMQDDSYLSEMHFVKDNLVRVTDTPESSDEAEDGNQSQCNLVVSLASLDALTRGFGCLGQFIELDFGGKRRIVERLLGRSAPLSQASLRR
jgi:hypothetical protein